MAKQQDPLASLARAIDAKAKRRNPEGPVILPEVGDRNTKTTDDSQGVDALMAAASAIGKVNHGSSLEMPELPTPTTPNVSRETTPDLPTPTALKTREETVPDLPHVQLEREAGNIPTPDLPPVSTTHSGESTESPILPSVQSTRRVPEDPLPALPDVQSLKSIQNDDLSSLPSVRPMGGQNEDIPPRLPSVNEGTSRKDDSSPILPMAPSAPRYVMPEISFPEGLATAIDRKEEAKRQLAEEGKDLTKELLYAAPRIPSQTIQAKVEDEREVSPNLPAVTARPWEKIISFEKTTVNTGLDSADIGDNQLRTASDIIFDNGVAEVGQGQAAMNTGDRLGVSARVLDGVWRAYDKAANKQLIAFCEGAGYYWVDAAGIPAGAHQHITWFGSGINVTGLATGYPFSFLNSHDTTLIANGYDDAMQYVPRTKVLQKLGIEPPRFYKKVAYFESDETVYVLFNFTSGSHELIATNVVAGATSGATGIVMALTHISGSWGTTDEAGTICIQVTSGTFQAENINETSPGTVSDCLTIALSTCQTNNTVFRPEERTGNSKTSLKLSAAATATSSGYVGYSAAQDYHAFPNGQDMSNDDYLVVYIFHETRAYINTTTGIELRFFSAAHVPLTNFYTVTITPSELDPTYSRNNQWTKLLIKRSRFVASGSVNWNSISGFYASLTAVTGTATIYIDNVHWKNCPIVATKYKKILDNFDGQLADWTVSAGTATLNMDVKYKYEGSHSLKWTHNADGTIAKNLTTAQDLTQYIDGITSQDSDEVCLRVYCMNTTNLTGITIYCLTNTATPPTGLGAGTTGYYFPFLTATAGHFNLTETGAWTDLRCKKSAFSNMADGVGGGWADIRRVAILCDRAAGSPELYFDDFRLEENLLKKTIRTMEVTETWTGTGGTDSDYGRGSKEDCVEGVSSYYVDVPKGGSYSIQSSFTAVNLTIFGASETSGNDDLICFWVKWNTYKNIASIKLKLDCNLGDYSTDFYEYEVSPSQLAVWLNMSGIDDKKLNNLSVFVELKKSVFTRIGATGAKGWDTVCGSQFKVTAMDGTGYGGGVKCWFDHLYLRRSSGLTGIYEFCAIFFTSDNVLSGASEWSNQITLAGTKALIKNIPVSVDPNVIGRMVFRKGGSLGPTARLDTTLWDNTTTQTEISIVDELTGRLLGGDDIPSGTIRVPLGAKFCDKLFNNRAILFRDPSNLRRIYWSNPGFFYAWSELQALDFASEVTDVYVIGGILYVNTLNSMIQIQNDLGNITGQDLQEQGHTLPSMTPFGSCAVDDQRGIPSHDGFYLSAGYQHSRISDPVKNYFVGTAYTQSSIRSVYSQKHLYVSVITSGGTRTLLDCYVPEMAWRTSAYIANSFCVLDAPGDSLQIYYGSTDGYIYPMNPGTYAVAPILESRDFMPSSPFEELVIRGVDVIAKSLSASPGYLNFKFRVNQVLNDSIILTFPNFSAVVFSGSGLNDMTCDATELGTYNLTDPEFFTVRISTVAGTDKFDWTSDGRTWTIGVSCAATNTLEDHITITWGAITGHTIGDTWTFCPSHLKSTYSLHRQIIQGVQSYVKGNMIGVRIYGGVASKQWSVKAIRLFGEIQEISTLFETL